MGNGGSAATASHWACDMNKNTAHSDGKRFHVHCLNDNIPTILAYANDHGYESIFADQLAGRLTSDHLVVGISAGSKSKNIIAAIKLAKNIGAKTVGILGPKEEQLHKIVDYEISIDSRDIQIIEDLHVVCLHMTMKQFSQTQS